MRAEPAMNTLQGRILQENILRGNILIVDDTPENLHILSDMLAVRGYEVWPALNGHTALASAEAAPPDLILLDIMMPGMNGFEVCKRLKANPQTCDIPVIFITALNEAMDKVRAFSVGGVDYITRPFQIEEVLARVETHVALRRAQQRLQEQVAELDAFAHTVAHNLKNPLSVVIGCAEVLVEDVSAVEPDVLNALLINISQSGLKAVDIIEELLLLAGVRKKEVEMQPLDMAAIVIQVQQRLEVMIEGHRGEIILPKTWPVVKGYAPWIEEVWANYLSNGLKYGGQPPCLELGATCQSNGMARFWVRDNGPGLASAAQSTLFTEFTRLSEVRAEGDGLGLSIVRRIMDKLGGQVGVNSQIGQGSEFYFTLPAN